MNRVWWSILRQEFMQTFNRRWCFVFGLMLGIAAGIDIEAWVLALLRP